MFEIKFNSNLIRLRSAYIKLRKLSSFVGKINKKLCIPFNQRHTQKKVMGGVFENY